MASALMELVVCPTIHTTNLLAQSFWFALWSAQDKLGQDGILITTIFVGLSIRRYKVFTVYQRRNLTEVNAGCQSQYATIPHT